MAQNCQLALLRERCHVHVLDPAAGADNDVAESQHDVRRRRSECREGGTQRNHMDNVRKGPPQVVDHHSSRRLADMARKQTCNDDIVSCDAPVRILVGVDVGSFVPSFG